MMAGRLEAMKEGVYLELGPSGVGDFRPLLDCPWAGSGTHPFSHPQSGLDLVCPREEHGDRNCFYCFLGRKSWKSVWKES